MSDDNKSFIRKVLSGKLGEQEIQRIEADQAKEEAPETYQLQVHCNNCGLDSVVDVPCGTRFQSADPSRVCTCYKQRYGGTSRRHDLCDCKDADSNVPCPACKCNTII